MNDEFVASASKWKLGLLSLACAGMAATGLWALGLFGNPPEGASVYPTTVNLIGALITVFSLVWLLILGKMAIVDAEYLRINAKGISDHRWSEQLIPWSQITKIETWTYHGSHVINLHLANPELFPGKGIGGALRKLNRRMADRPIQITVTGMDKSLSEVLTAIEYYSQK